MAEAAAEVADGLAEGARRIRTTARWLTVTFGAVAAALLTGLQLRGLSDATGGDRTWALVGYGLGVAGVLVAIFAAAVTMTAGGVTLHELATPERPKDIYETLNARRDLYPGSSSITDLAQKAEQAMEQQAATAAIKQTPVVATATLTEGGLEAHRAELGAACTRSDVGAIVTGADGKAYTLMIVPTATNRCGPVQITLKRSEGSVASSGAVVLEP